MNESLLHITTAFGLGTATGLNASLPLVIVAGLGRAGYLSLSPPFTALTSDVAFWGLLALALLELLADKVPGLDSLAHQLLFPLSVAAGAVLAGSQSGAIAEAHPGLAVLVGLLTGGTVSAVAHTVRSTLRPATHLLFIGQTVSIVEDLLAATFTNAALFAPWAVPILLLGLAVVGFFFIRLLLKAAGGFWDLIRRWFDRRSGGQPRAGGAGAMPGSPDDELDWLEAGRERPGGSGHRGLQEEVIRRDDDFRWVDEARRA